LKRFDFDYNTMHRIKLNDKYCAVDKFKALITADLFVGWCFLSY